MSPHTLIAACAFGLESLVKRELSALGYEATVVQPGRVAFAGDESAVCRANLWLRSADRVLVQIGTIDAGDFDQLFEGTQTLPWETWIAADAAFPVSGKSRKSQLTSVPAIQRSVKRAIVERMRKGHHTETLPETGAKVAVEVALLDDRAALTIDTTGPSLHKRGYRKLVGGAPLKETLAAALVELSVWQADRPLVDPFCGSGTIPIEAALVGLNVAPGLRRTFAAESWPQIGADLWRRARDEAEQLIDREQSLQIIGTDIDADALSLARHHAEQAGVAEQVHFQQKPFAELRSKREYGCVITNPPYGMRMDTDRQVEQLYKSLPGVLQRLPTWSHFVITAMADFERVVERTATRRRKLYNGRIECTYYQFLGPRPPRMGESAAAAVHSAGDTISASDTPSTSDARQPSNEAPVFGGLDEKAHEQAALFESRLRKRARHLRRWPTARGITCYRLYERDIPEIPLVVDRYEDSLHITEYERPHDRDLGQHAAWLALMQKTAARVLDVPIQRVALKSRQRLRDRQQYEKQADLGKLREVHEGGLRFLVNLTDYVDTGLFLDHRETRAMVRREAAGRRMINLFGYTGSFTVYAAAGGAEATTTVDTSQNYLDWAAENMAINELAGPQHTFVRQDALTFVEQLPAEPLFDLAVVDPPTFSNRKASDVDWDVQRDHVRLLSGVIARMSKGGVIYFATNFRRFRFDQESIAGVTFREISRQTVPADFRNRRIHRCWRLVVV